MPRKSMMPLDEYMIHFVLEIVNMAIFFCRQIFFFAIGGVLTEKGVKTIMWTIRD